MSVELNWVLLRWGMGLAWDRCCHAKKSKPSWVGADAHEGRAPTTLSPPILGHLYGHTHMVHAQQLCEKSSDWCLYRFGVNPSTAHLSAVAWQLCYGLSYHTLGLFGMEVGGSHGQGDYKSWGRTAAGSSNTQQMLLWLCNMVPQRGKRSTSFSLRRMLLFSSAAITCC